MKKTNYLLMALALTGSVLSILLLLQHFYPDSRLAAISCGEGLINPCMVLVQSNFSTLFGIPIASYGLIYYLAFLFILLIADYAGGAHQRFSLVLLLPMASAAVAADIALAVILIHERLYCTLCMSTYIVNIAMLAVMLFMTRRMIKNEGFSFKETFRLLLSQKDISSDRKAFNAAFILFLFWMAFSIVTTSYTMVMKDQSSKPQISPQQKEAFLTGFYNSEKIDIDLTQSAIVLGNPGAKVTIVSFTDFLCSACYRFYQTEKYLFSKYRDKIKVVYFNYPLDSACNPDVERSVYDNSCIASRAIASAAEKGILEEYIVKHFADYKKIKNEYSTYVALDHYQKASGSDAAARDEFLNLMNSERISGIVKKQIELAQGLGINATPTIFISGRRIEGVLPIEILESIIDNELKSQ